MNDYGGLSASQLLSLFGATPSSAASGSSSSTSAASASSSPIDATASNGNDPMSSIKAILAEAQISNVSTAGGWSVTAAETAYAHQMQAGGTIPSTDALTNGSINFLSESDAYASFNTSFGQSGMVSSQHFGYQGFTLDKSNSVAATTSGPTAASSPDPSSISSRAGATNPSSITTIQLSTSMKFQSANQSLGIDASVAFSVAGLGNLTALPNSNVLQAHAIDAGHDYSDVFDLDAVLNGEMSGFTINIQGLTATQAQDVMTSFQKAAADDNIYDDTGQGYNSNFSVFYGAGMSN